MCIVDVWSGVALILLEFCCVILYGGCDVYSIGCWCVGVLCCCRIEGAMWGFLRYIRVLGDDVQSSQRALLCCGCYVVFGVVWCLCEVFGPRWCPVPVVCVAWWIGLLSCVVLCGRYGSIVWCDALHDVVKWTVECFVTELGFFALQCFHVCCETVWGYLTRNCNLLQNLFDVNKNTQLENSVQQL